MEPLYILLLKQVNFGSIRIPGWEKKKKIISKVGERVFLPFVPIANFRVHVMAVVYVVMVLPTVLTIEKYLLRYCKTISDRQWIVKRFEWRV